MIARLVLLFLVGLAAAAHAQTPLPEARRAIVLDDPVGAVASLGSEWLMVYPPTAPAPLPGTPWYTALKVTLTPTSGTTAPRVVTIPRAAIVRETLATRCPGGGVPCLRADNVALPVGEFTLRAAFVAGDGAEGGASDPVPFSGAYPRPSVPRVRALPE